MRLKQIPQFAVRAKLKLQEFMPKLALVADVVAQIEILWTRCHVREVLSEFNFLKTFVYTA